MAAQEDLDDVDFESFDWGNDEDVEEFLKSCNLEEDTQSQSDAISESRPEPEAKRAKGPSQWTRLRKHVLSGHFSRKKNPFLKDLVRSMMHKHVGAIIVADCHSAAYKGTSLNDYLGPDSKNYLLLGQSNNTYSYILDGTTDKFSRDIHRELSKLETPLDTLQSIHVIFPHFNEVKQDAIRQLESAAVHFQKPLDADMHAFITSKQLFATKIDSPYVSTLERDGEPGVPELNKYIKLKYLDPSCSCTFGINENFFTPDKLRWDSGEVLNTVTLAPDMVTILIMFGCARNIDGGHDAFQQHVVPSGTFSSRRVPRRILKVPQVIGYLPRKSRKRSKKDKFTKKSTTKGAMLRHSKKSRRKGAVHFL